MFLEQAYTGKNQWYIYVLTLLIVFTATQIGNLPLVAYMMYLDPESLKTGNIAIATGTNTGLALTLFSFTVGFFALLLCVRYIHQKPYISIVTARRKIDWKRIFFGAGIWGALTLITFIVQYATTDSSEIQFQFEPMRFLGLLAVSLVLFPFQTSFEELLFRGYLMQWAALLFKYRWVAVLLTGLLFGAMHGANPEVGAYGMWVAMPQYIFMGLILGYVAVKDNGMEISLGLHLANNILAALTFTSDASALQTSALFKDLNPTASHWDTLMLLVAGVLFIWICNRKYRFAKKIDLWKKIETPEGTPNVF